MEGDAGASRLNPPPMPKFGRLRRRRLKSSEEPVVDAVDPVSEESPDPQGGSDSDDAPVAPESDDEPSAPGGEESSGAEGGSESDDDAVVASGADAAEERGASRLGRGWLIGIAAALVLSAGGIGAGGYFALRTHQQSQAIARNDMAALKAAVDCVSATQAPDTNAMNASEQKIIDCGTDNFRSQALLYTSMLVQAYQAANIHVQVADVRAAVERNNRDGSIDVLVAMRVKVASDQTQNETGYRLRVKMALAEGQYKISKLDQVTK